jgi:hypothetical protein
MTTIGSSLIVHEVSAFHFALRLSTIRTPALSRTVGSSPGGALPSQLIARHASATPSIASAVLPPSLRAVLPMTVLGLPAYFFRWRNPTGASALPSFRSHQFWYKSTLNMSRSMKITIHWGM